MNPSSINPASKALESAKGHEITLTIGQLSSRATLLSTLISLAVTCTRKGGHLRRTEHRTLPCGFSNTALQGHLLVELKITIDRLNSAHSYGKFSVLATSERKKHFRLSECRLFHWRTFKNTQSLRLIH